MNEHFILLIWKNLCDQNPSENLYFFPPSSNINKDVEYNWKNVHEKGKLLAQKKRKVNFIKKK
jgi:hypothetical protein